MLVYALIALGIVLRLVPHLPNVAPITGLALFCGVYMKGKQALWVPITAMIVSDAFLGSESLTTRLSVYGSFFLIGLIGLYLRSRKNVHTIIASSLIGSGIFYLVTNFAFLYPSNMYSHNWQGVMVSYFNALPFFRNTILGDLFYTGFFFGVYELALYVNRNKTLATEQQK